jgi:hypothetical protein
VASIKDIHGVSDSPSVAEDATDIKVCGVGLDMGVVPDLVDIDVSCCRIHALDFLAGFKVQQWQAAVASIPTSLFTLQYIERTGDCGLNGCISAVDAPSRSRDGSDVLQHGGWHQDGLQN